MAAKRKRGRRRGGKSTRTATTVPTSTTVPPVVVTSEPPIDDHGGTTEGGDHDLSDPLFFFNTTPKIGSIATPGIVPADKTFEMKFVNRSKDMPDGREIDFWTFEDRLRRTEPEVVVAGSLIRVNEGDIVHVTVRPSKRQHTIHMHGIEADTFNDGVGHTSFEVTGEYTYQFRAGAPFRALDDPRPKTRGAGLYFYHCHVNTALHFHMGMYGGLLIDPATGPGTAFHGGPEYDVNAEGLWFSGDVDPVWHELGHAAGMKGGDAGLNVFNPVYFHLTTQFQPMRNGFTDPDGVIDDPSVAVVGEFNGLPALIRWANTAYARQRITFHGVDNGFLDVQVISTDGRPFDNAAPNFAGPVSLTSPLESASSERYEFLVTPRKRGTSFATIESLDWVTGRVMGLVRTTISFN
jgi:hypothetical protein